MKSMQLFDNQTVNQGAPFPTNPDAPFDEITVIDHALTRPWTITKRYRRDPNAIRLSPNRVRRRGVVGEIEVVAEAKRKPHLDDSARDKRERTHQENALDEALKDTTACRRPRQIFPDDDRRGTR
jgi:hypothetical protein